MQSLIDTRPFPALPPVFNLAGHVLARGRSSPEKTALVMLHPDRDALFSYREVTAQVLGAATALLALGLRPGDRVLMRLQNGLGFPVVFLGAIAAGLVPVATSAALTVAEVTRLALRVDPRLIVADPGVALPDHPAPRLAPDPVAWGKLPPADFHLGDPGREAYVVFTSGSSGQPEAVSHAHRAILARAAMHVAWEALGPDDRLLHAGALNWTYTLGAGLLDPWTVGATALIPAPDTPTAALPALLARAEATIFAAVPGVFRQMLRAGLPTLPQLRHALSAGESLPTTLRVDWQRQTGTDVHEALGMSELSTYISGAPGRPAPAGTAGLVQPGRLVACLDDAGDLVPRDTPGELAVSTADPGFMRGYLGRPAPEGPWFRTGDMVRMSATGAITHLGRRDDLMNAGGFRTSPLEIEAAFHDLPGLTACAATEVEVAPGTRIIALFYEAGCGIDAAPLRQRAELALARYKQPRHYQQVETLPRTANGKLIRRAVAALYQRPDP
ncbi:class I adenylate-forming enzyme family protein [Tabrizicola sp.]|uniref:class I adenylate-forming enzyme family protein n=1 Tax=Tabrizicola sp. TaxID=2005166 RepID=UPI002634ECA4|nr:class I adenylate-forming enzyme family protein [Tabrizicola sp.]MDM7931001.1 class I adenylate-forming enzyme family protein [Tabrizicola sp.]